MKGSGKMTQYDQMNQMLSEQGGILRLPAVRAAGISKPVFYDYVKSHNLEKTAPGIYCSQDSWVDAMYLLHLRFGQIVFSHESALYLHDLTDRETTAYMVTAKTGYNTTKLKTEGVKVFTIKAELHKVGLTSATTTFGHTVPTYDMERTICDVLRSRNSLEAQVIHGALKAYVQRTDKNLRKLMQYAEMFRVEKILRPYLEVLL